MSESETRDRKLAPGVDWTAVSRILVHKPDHLGDALCAVPAISLLRKAAPHAVIAAAATGVSGGLWKALKIVDEYYVLPGPAWWRTRFLWRYPLWARGRRFDLAVNFRHDTRDIGMMRFMGARLVCTYDHKGRGRFASHAGGVPSEEKSEAENHVGLLAATGLAAQGVEPVSLPSAATAFAESILPGSGPFIAFNPFARTPAKTWDTKKATALLRLLHAEGLCPILVGGQENTDAAKEFGRDIPGIVNLVGRTSALDLLAVLRRCSLAVSTDSAPGHAAALVGTRVVSLMSGTNNHARWAPKGAAVLRREVPCAPCALEECVVEGHPCMAGIEVEDVLQAVREALRR